MMEDDASQILKRKILLFLPFCFGFGNFTIREGKRKPYVTFIGYLIRFYFTGAYLIDWTPMHPSDC